MANKVVVTKNKLNAIGDAIREKLGKTQQYTLDEMPVKIRAISGSGSSSGATVTITTDTEDFYGKNVALTNGTDTMTARFSNQGMAVFNGVEMEGNLTASVEFEGETYSSADIKVQVNYETELNFIPKIYGAKWTVASNPSWTRTDDAADFDDPVAAIGTGEGSSPFDDIMPWAGMVKVERTGGTMVAIPKFYYKLERTGNALSIKIANSPTAGFHVSPAHMDRGDGKGERNVVYVGRYKCSNANLKSQIGAVKHTFSPASDIRTAIHQIDSHVWQWDFAMLFTIRLLYLVEFAHWDSQKKIGLGITDNYEGGFVNSGRSDSMNYHTGTIKTSRDTPGAGIQYRYIEDLWANGTDIVDGLMYQYVNARSEFYTVIDLEHIDDFNYGRLSFTSYPSNGIMSDFEVSTDGHFPLFYPSSTIGYNNRDTYSCDSIDGCKGKNYFAGGDNQGQSEPYCRNCGLFSISFSDAETHTFTYITSRLMELP